MLKISALEAGFDGERGMRFPSAGEDYRVYLKRGTESPSDYPDEDFLEQLIWVHPPDSEARLLWCNADSQWFELQFIPIENP